MFQFLFFNFFFFFALLFSAMIVLSLLTLSKPDNIRLIVDRGTHKDNFFSKMGPAYLPTKVTYLEKFMFEFSHHSFLKLYEVFLLFFMVYEPPWVT